MRIVLNCPCLAVLALLSMGDVYAALAEPPPPPTATPAAPVTGTPVTPTSPAVSAPAAPAAAAPKAETASVTSSSASAQVNTAQVAEENRLRSAGYRPEMRNGTKVWCRREFAIGSHLIAQKVCGTPDELKLSAQQNQDSTRDVQKLYNQTLK